MDQFRAWRTSRYRHRTRNRRPSRGKAFAFDRRMVSRSLGLYNSGNPPSPILRMHSSSHNKKMSHRHSARSPISTAQQPALLFRTRFVFFQAAEFRLVRFWDANFAREKHLDGRLLPLIPARYGTARTFQAHFRTDGFSSNCIRECYARCPDEFQHDGFILRHDLGFHPKAAGHWS